MTVWGNVHTISWAHTNFSVYSCVSTREDILPLRNSMTWGLFTRNLMWTEAVITCKLICLRLHVLMHLHPHYLPQQGTWMHLPTYVIKCFITHSGSSRSARGHGKVAWSPFRRPARSANLPREGVVWERGSESMIRKSTLENILLLWTVLLL